MATEPFVPLTSGLPANVSNTEFRVLLAERPEQARPFRGQEAPSSNGTPSLQALRKTCDPRVSLQREGNRVNMIHIECSCGQVIDLACAYETEAPSAAS